jgi:hypothetical protein
VRTRKASFGATLLVGVVALLALGASSASAWEGNFQTGPEQHNSRVVFELKASEHRAVMTYAHVYTLRCGLVLGPSMNLVEGLPAVQSANGWATFRHWSPERGIDLNFDLSRHGDRVTAKGTAFAHFGLCSERFSFEATTTAHGLH